ncbi:MAG: replication initiator protein A [Rhodomicrobium sp.]
MRSGRAKPLGSGDRRLYEIARRHCGKHPAKKISVPLLQKKCGSRQAEKHFFRPFEVSLSPATSCPTTP